MRYFTLSVKFDVFLPLIYYFALSFSWFFLSLVTVFLVLFLLQKKEGLKEFIKVSAALTVFVTLISDVYKHNWGQK